MSKLVIDQLQRHGGPPITLPSAIGKGVVEMDADGELKVNTLSAPVEFSKIIDFEANPVSTLDFLWTEIAPDVEFNDIAFVKMQGAGISSSGESYLRFYGLNAGGAPIQTGYLGCSFDGSYNGTQTTSSNNNGNSGYFQFPNYTSAASTGYSYGSGAVFDLVWHLRKEGGNGNYMVNISGGYQQQTSYNHPNTENAVWDGYGTSTPPASAEGGFRLETTSGSFNRGTLKVDLVLK